jgi:hypothetical protein
MAGSSSLPSFCHIVLLEAPMIHKTFLLTLTALMLASSAYAAKQANFSKVCSSGELAGTGSCPVDPVVGNGPDEWACTLDHNTQLLWSIQTHANKTWAQATDQSRDGLAADYNGSARCGFQAQWRLPTRVELGSIAPRLGQPRVVDAAYFPEAVYNWFWSSDPLMANPRKAWIGFFYNGLALPRDKAQPMHVRLVHSVVPQCAQPPVGTDTVTTC